MRAKLNEDPHFYCKKGVEKISSGVNPYNKEKINVWIVTDARHKTDLDFFSKSYANVSKTVRVVADESTRSNRNWKFVDGIDNDSTECDLDSFNHWDFLIKNNNDHELEKCLENLILFLGKQKKN